MEDKENVSVAQVEQDKADVSRAFETRREMWKHMMRGGAIKTQQDYSKYNVFIRPWVAALDRNGDAVWNYGMRTPFLAANKAIDVIRAHIPTKTASGK